MNIKLPISIVLVFLISLAQMNVAGQEETKQVKRKPSFINDGRNWTIAIPIWVPGFRGELAYGEFSMDGGVGGGNLNPFDYGLSVEFYFVSKVSFKWKNVFTSFDIFSGTIGNSLTFKRTGNEIVNASVTAVLPRLIAGYKIINTTSESGKTSWNLSLYTGLRYNRINISSDKNNRINDINISPDWLDILLGIRVPVYINRWAIVAEGDVGGLENFNKLSWFMQLEGLYRASHLVSLRFAWAILNLKHSEEIGDKQFTARVKLTGPSVGINFHF